MKSDTNTAERADRSRMREALGARPAAASQQLALALVHPATGAVLGVRLVRTDAATADDCLELAEELYALCGATSSRPPTVDGESLVVHRLDSAEASRVLALMTRPERGGGREEIFVLRTTAAASLRACPEQDFRSANKARLAAEPLADSAQRPTCR
jgi:hypothetical protein